MKKAIIFNQDDACPICGKGKLVQQEGRQQFHYKGKTKTVSNFVFLTCTKCKEGVENQDNVKKFGRILREWHRSVDNFLSGEEIKSIRKSIGCTQRVVGLVIGTGEKSFARYENSTLTQSRPVDQLLRILQSNPNLFWRLPGASKYQKNEVDYSVNYQPSQTVGLYVAEEQLEYGSGS